VVLTSACFVACIAKITSRAGKDLTQINFQSEKAEIQEPSLSMRFNKVVQRLEEDIAIDVMLAARIIHGVKTRDRTPDTPHFEI